MKAGEQFYAYFSDETIDEIIATHQDEDEAIAWFESIRGVKILCEMKADGGVKMDINKIYE